MIRSCPPSTKGLLAAKVAQRGAMANLLQRSISRYGHCTFAIPEMIGSLNDLATWVDTGVKPAA
ncbi:MAG: hypothetical protein JNL26_08885 [Gemmatimonadetes bacterium]|nr:hypothetical protein [Gemmatimonadota bacterium]